MIRSISAGRLRLIALCSAVVCIVGVVGGVVATGRDGRIIDLVAVGAVASLVIAWRIRRRSQHEPVAD
jgi:hypothetical protein